MFCTNCGNNLELGGNFCGQCGRSVRLSRSPEIEKPLHKIESSVIEKPVVEPRKEYNPPPLIPRRSKTAEAKAEKKKEELREDLRKLLEKEQGKDVSDQELFEAEHWLTGFASLLLDLGVKEAQRNKKLEANPKGFHLEGEGYSCFICGTSISKEETWYDKHGIKCLICQSAIDRKIIPATAASDKDSWYTVHDFEHHLFINRWGVKKLVKEGLLKPRIIPSPAGGTHYHIFLIKDHEGILPPKKLTEWPTVKFQKDGEDWYGSEPWFMHSDPKEVLKGYKILELMGILEEKHISKSFPQLSYQIPKGAKSIMKIKHIESKASKPSESEKSK